jgi:transposase
MSQGPRVLRPERGQLRWEMVDLDSQLPPEHRARLVWSFVAGLDLADFYARIKARDDTAGRPASDPAVLLAVWLYATLEGIGAARAIERLCEHHAAYRWLCGGVPVNHDMLSAFRRDSGPELDRLLTQSLTGLIAEGLVTLEEVMIDGTKTQARAGRGSLAQAERLTRIETRVTEHVARLKRELEEDPAGPERRRQERALRAATEQEVRLRRARAKLVELEEEKRERAKTHAKAEAAKSAPAVSTSDPEVRSMKMADGATRPAWNVQVATAQGFVVTIEPTDRRNDSGLAADLVAQIEQRCGAPPTRLLADGTAMTQDEIVGLAEHCPGLTVYTPLPRERDDVTAETLRKRQWQRQHEPNALRDWRARMASKAGQAVYRRRKLTEHAHAKMKNRGFVRMAVHGIAKVRVVCLLHALAHNMMQAHGMRAAFA